MIERLVLIKDALSITITSLPNAPEFLYAREWNILSDCISILKPIELMTTNLSGEKFPMRSFVIPLIRDLQYTLKITLNNTEIGESLRNSLLTIIARCLGTHEVNKIAAKTTLLDPKFKIPGFCLKRLLIMPKSRKLVTLPKRLEWNTAFKDYIKSLDDRKPVIICGDMNVAHTEIDLARPASNTKNAGFTQEERDGMTDFLQDGYIDTFRKLYPEKTDQYTFWTYMANARAKNFLSEPVLNCNAHALKKIPASTTEQAQ
ncbi:hypothetical protein NQ314_018679 [Rhamnusium bicolor]|uniref:DNA repair nuclease/redox regulator APEX1 n=1 Tax=Rhamnusium bicolor TaxID=1586634 RepID=A0AAV8WRE1_9CUCU|nr:hypothetical protein NQ314_018679 [Rhamnusium bicolor]